MFLLFFSSREQWCRIAVSWCGSGCCTLWCHATWCLILSARRSAQWRPTWRNRSYSTYWKTGQESCVHFLQGLRFIRSQLLCEERFVCVVFVFFCVYLCLIFGRDCASVLHEHNFSRDVWSAGEVADETKPCRPHFAWLMRVSGSLSAVLHVSSTWLRRSSTYCEAVLTSSLSWSPIHSSASILTGPHTVLAVYSQDPTQFWQYPHRTLHSSGSILTGPYTVLAVSSQDPTQFWQYPHRTLHSSGSILTGPHTVLAVSSQDPTQFWQYPHRTPHSPGSILTGPHTVLAVSSQDPTQFWQYPHRTPHSSSLQKLNCL